MDHLIILQFGERAVLEALNKDAGNRKPMNIKRRSLIIGVNGYRSGIGPLRFCVSDAKRLKSVLNRHQEGFIATESILLTEDQPDKRHPTKFHITKSVIYICNGASDEDTLLIYFSGRGAIGEDGCFYLLPLDVNSASIGQTSISWQWIKEKVEESQAKTKIIILDAWHEDVGKDVPSSTFASSKMVEELEQSGGGFVCLISCSGGQFSYEHTELERSVFSHYLVTGIAGAADPLGRGIIDVENLYTFVRDRTFHHIKQIGVEQEPYLINKTTSPLSTLIISAAHAKRPINCVLVLTEDPLLGRLLEAGIRLDPLVQEAIWTEDIEQVFSDAKIRFDYDAVYIDVRQKLDIQNKISWSRKRELILFVRRKYPIVPFVLVGLRELFLKGLEEQDRQRFSHYFFFDLQRPISLISALISDTLELVEWDIRSNAEE